MPAMEGFTNFSPEKDIPSLEGKVIFITGGTAGLGAESAKALAAHNPEHIYLSGRNAKAGDALIAEIKSTNPKAGLTFIEMDLASLVSVKSAVSKHFKHDRLDVLMNNAGIMAAQPKLGPDGYEVQFATNHLGHAMLTQQLLPYLLAAAKKPGSDVRVVTNTSLGYRGHPREGISFKQLESGSTFDQILGPWIRYGQSKLANILFVSELARRYPQITSVVIHPGVVNTPLLQSQSMLRRWFISVVNWLSGISTMEPHQGAWNQLWCAAGARKEELVNGSFYMPVGVESFAKLDKTAQSAKLAKELWEWTEGVLKKV